MISWREEESLQLEHKLKVRRIWLSRTLNLVVFGVIAFLAHWVGADYASELQLKRDRQKDYYDNRVEAYTTLDSLFRNAVWSYHMGTYQCRDSCDHEGQTRAASRVHDDGIRLQAALSKYHAYTSDELDTYTTNCIPLITGASYIDPNSWEQYEQFVNDLYHGFEDLVGTEFADLAGEEIHAKQRNFFRPTGPVKQTPGPPNRQDYINNFIEKYAEWLKLDLPTIVIVFDSIPEKRDSRSIRDKENK